MCKRLTLTLAFLGRNSFKINGDEDDNDNDDDDDDNNNINNYYLTRIRMHTVIK